MRIRQSTTMHRSKLVSRIAGLGAALFLVLISGTFLPSCRPSSTPLLVPLELPKDYRVEATGTLSLDSLHLPGRFLIDYQVYPDGRVRSHRFVARMRDGDIVTTFAFWETNRERLRCTTIANTGPMEGTLDPSGTIVMPPGSVRLVGLSYAERGFVDCVGLAREISATNDADVNFRHDPASDTFSFNGTFTGSYDGNRIDIRVEAAGHFVNRPPAALLGVAGPGIPPDTIQGGCPPLEGNNPPVIKANTPTGLELQLLSLTSDPDSGGRGSLAREQWSHSADGAPFRSLGHARLVGSALFLTGQDHVLALTSYDQVGAAGRMVCRFRVVDP